MKEGNKKKGARLPTNPQVLKWEGLRGSDKSTGGLKLGAARRMGDEASLEIGKVSGG